MNQDREPKKGTKTGKGTMSGNQEREPRRGAKTGNQNGEPRLRNKTKKRERKIRKDKDGGKKEFTQFSILKKSEKKDYPVSETL